MADGSIIIQAQIDTKKATSQLTSLENRMVKTADKIDGLKTKMSEMGSTKIPTEKFASLQKEIERCDGQMEKLYASLKSAMASGASESRIKKINAELEKTSDKMMTLNDLAEKMESNGTAYTTAQEANPEQYQKMSQDLRYAESEMSLLSQKHDELVAKQEKLGKSGKKIWSSLGDTLSAVEKRVAKLALRVFIFSQITKAFRAMVTAMQEGFKNLAQYSDKYNQSMSQLKSAQAELKNNMAAAFEPIANWIIPALAQLCGWLSTAAETISKFFAALSGSKTYTKATKQTINYANSVKEADKAQKGALASFDDLNVLEKDNSSSGSASGESTGADAFEEGTMTDEFYDRIQKIKEILEGILPFVIAIGAALLAWRLISFLTDLMKVSPLLASILAILLIIAGTALAVYSYMKMWKEGVDWKGIIGYVTGVTLAFAGLYVLFGPMVAGIALLVAGIAGLVLAIQDIVTNGLNAQNLGLLMISTIGIIIGVFIAFGATAAGIVTIIALVVSILAMLVSYGGTGAETLQHLKNAFSSLGDFISKIFAGDVEGAFEDLKEAGKEFGNFFISIAEGIGNAFISMVNSVIDAINSLSIEIPEWVPFFGGDVWTPNLPRWNATLSIPRLANGGITTGSTLAQIGEAGREAVLPLENNTGWMDDLANRLIEVMETSGSGTATMEIDGRKFGELVYPYVKGEAQRIGTSFAAN